MAATKKFDSELVGLEDGHIIFNLKNEKVKIPIEVIEKAKLVFEFKSNKPPVKGGGQRKQKG